MPYGYIIDPENKNHLLPDPETAHVVRQIFVMYIRGDRICVDGSHVRLDRVLDALDLGCQLIGHAAQLAKLVDLALNFCVAHW